MRKIVLKGSTPKEFPLGAGLTIGSASTNTIQISSNKVEGEHATIFRKGEHIWIEDLNTRYGLMVNGKKVSRWALKKEDLIEIGGTALTYDEDDKPEPAPPSAKTTPPAKPKEAAGNGAKAPSVKNAPAAKPDKVPSPASKSGSTPAINTSKSAISPAAASHAKLDPKVSASAMKSVTSKMIEPAAKKNGASSGIQSGVRDSVSPTNSSTRSSISPAAKAKSGLLGSVGAGSSSRNVAPPSGGSSRREESVAAMSQAALTAIKERASGRTPPLPDNGSMLKIAVGVLLVLVLILGSTTLIVLSRGGGGKVTNSKDEAEAAERLKLKQPKDPKDLEYFKDKFHKLRRWEDVEALLGEPDMTVNEKIAVFEAERGTYDLTGHESRAWYIKDPYNSALSQDSTVATILLFQGAADGTVTYLATKVFSRIKLDAEKKPADTRTGNSDDPERRGPGFGPEQGNAPVAPAPPMPPSASGGMGEAPRMP